MFSRFRSLLSSSWLFLLTAALLCPAETRAGQKFYADDPLRVDNDRAVDVGQPAPHALSDMYDFIVHSFGKPGDRTPGRAANINTLGEVPDSSWFTNRHGRARMTLEELARGPDRRNGPSDEGVWMVINAKTEGLTPGFSIRDSNGDIYVIKFDPPDNAEMATAAEIISTKFFHAIGYHVPENYLVYLDRDRLRVDPEAMVEEGLDEVERMEEEDLDELMERTHRSEDGTYRAVASKFLDGDPLGPFQYSGTRPDDANDIFIHEDRRELRGLRVLASWLNHDDSRAINSQDMVITENGTSFIRHHLIDFGSTLGSGSVTVQKHRAGWEYMWKPGTALRRIATLGLWDRQWIRINYPDLPSIGRFESEYFKPEEWKPEYPSVAFEKADLEDTYWGARIVMAFTDAEIRAIVKTGGLSDPGAEAYLIQRLIERRDKIGRHWFSLVNTADNFELTPTGLGFERLASTYGFGEPTTSTTVAWSRFDNQTGANNSLGPETPYSDTSIALPEPVQNSEDGSYFRARLRENTHTVDLYVRNSVGTLEIVGIERQPAG